MTDNKREVSEMDKKQLNLIRKSVSEFVEQAARDFDGEGVTVLDVAPQDHEGATPYFKLADIKTLDIDPDSGADYIADLCATNSEIIPDESFDVVVCTEVLEHTLQPFLAAEEIRRMLKPGGVALISSPFNFRIHGPLPDCWRFTEYGLRQLFKDFEDLDLTAVEDEERFLAPVHYRLIAKKKND